ncbi:MAG: hypothetical protein ABI638_11180, partial [Ignavibacteriota bacterium]
MRVLIFLIVLSNLVFAQYDSSMYNLIKTTYERSFDTHIVYKYLHPNSEQKTKAAILSIAQSEDTSFVPELLKLNLNKYGSEVCFALAQIGNCNQSLNFLWKFLYAFPPSETFPKIFFAIGKIGTDNDLRRIVEFYNSFDGPIFPYEGISEAILQFQIRGIKSDDAKLILENEVLHSLSTKLRIKEALFTLSRYKNSALTDEQFQDFIQTIFANEDDTEFKQFALMNIDKDLFLEDVFNIDNPLLAIQFLKILHFFHFKNQFYPNNNIELYLKFLNDKNPNVTLQSAVSIKNLKDTINDSSKLFIKNKIDSLLFDSTKSLSFKGELFLSRFELFGDYEEHMSLFEGGISIDIDQFLIFNIRSF